MTNFATHGGHISQQAGRWWQSQQSITLLIMVQPHATLSRLDLRGVGLTIPLIFGVWHGYFGLRLLGSCPAMDRRSYRTKPYLGYEVQAGVLQRDRQEISVPPTAVAMAKALLLWGTLGALGGCLANHARCIALL